MPVWMYVLRSPHELLLFVFRACVRGQTGVHCVGVAEKATPVQHSWTVKEIIVTKREEGIKYFQIEMQLFCAAEVSLGRALAFMNGQLESPIEQLWQKEKESKQIKTFMSCTITSSVCMNGTCRFCCGWGKTHLNNKPTGSLLIL